MLKDSNNWCPEIYRGVFINRHTTDQIVISPCCQAQGKITSVSDFDFNNNQYLQQLRQECSNGDRPDACKRCWQVEDAGGKSRRQSAIEFYGSRVDDTVKLQGLDFSATWACNSACIMCGPHSSSLWHSELNLDNKAPGKLRIRQNTVISRLTLGELKKVHFNGGEPLLTNDHLTVLKAAPLEDLFVSYNTNGTIYPDQQTLDLWSQTRLIKLFFSIDAVGAAFDYIRWPAKWQQVENNLKKMKAELPSNVMFGFNVAVGAYNVAELPELVDWFRTNLSTNREGDVSDFNWQIVYNYNPSSLQENIKKQILPMIEDYSELQGLHNYLYTSKYIDTNWQNQLNQIDQRRNTNWRESLKIGKIFC